MYIYVYTCTCKVYIHNVMYMYMLGAEHGFVRSMDCPARSVDPQSSTMLLARLHCSYHQPSGKQWPLPLIMHVQSRDYVIVGQSVDGLCKARIHALHRAIHGLCKSMLCTQHIHAFVHMYVYMYMYMCAHAHVQCTGTDCSSSL